MSVVEMLLRLGCSLVGWMVIYAHCLWLATLRVTGCGPDGDEFWRLLLGFAPFGVGFSIVIGASAKLPGIHQILRWGFVPMLVLVPLALLPVLSTFDSVNLKGGGICTAEPDGDWQLWWAPVQFITLLVVSFFVVRAWRPTLSDQ